MIILWCLKMFQIHNTKCIRKSYEVPSFCINNDCLCCVSFYILSYCRKIRLLLDTLPPNTLFWCRDVFLDNVNQKSAWPNLFFMCNVWYYSSWNLYLMTVTVLYHVKNIVYTKQRYFAVVPKDENNFQVRVYSFLGKWI